MSVLIGESFIDRLKTTKADYFSNERKSLEEEGLIGEILQDLEALFQQRHIHAHELAPRTIVGIHKMRGYSSCGAGFHVWNRDTYRKSDWYQLDLLRTALVYIFRGSLPTTPLAAGWFNSPRFVAESRPRTPTTDPADTKRRAKMLLSVNQISELTVRDRHGIPKRLENLSFTPGDKGAHLYESREALPLIYAVDNLEARVAQARSQAANWSGRIYASVRARFWIQLGFRT